MTRRMDEIERVDDGVAESARTSAVGVPVVVAPVQQRQTVFWVLAVLLSIIATALVMRSATGLASPAWAQSSNMVGGRGVYAFSGRLTSQAYGVFMLDVDAGTLWCYELDDGANTALQLRLVSARSWLFDRELQEFNTAAPVPSQVRELLQQQQLHQQSMGGSSGKPEPARMPDTPATGGQ